MNLPRCSLASLLVALLSTLACDSGEQNPAGGSSGAGQGGGAGAAGAGQGAGTAGHGGASPAGAAGAGSVAGAAGAGPAGAGGAAQGGAGSGGAAQGGAAQGGGSAQGGAPAGGGGGSAQGGSSGAGPVISPEAIELCKLVNEYRAQNGLPAAPLSTALMTVAAHHVQDMAAHPDAYKGSCNLHSWSDNPPLWSGCCYTPDHAQSQCMWKKPKEITASWGANAYPGNGYEDSSAGASTPAGALDQWKNSPSHNAVILNQDIWAQMSPWPALGCGMAGSFAVLWFGDAADPVPFQP